MYIIYSVQRDFSFKARFFRKVMWYTPLKNDRSNQKRIGVILSSLLGPVVSFAANKELQAAGVGTDAL